MDRKSVDETNPQRLGGFLGGFRKMAGRDDPGVVTTVDLFAGLDSEDNVVSDVFFPPFALDRDFVAILVYQDEIDLVIAGSADALNDVSFVGVIKFEETFEFRTRQGVDIRPDKVFVRPSVLGV